MQATLFAVLLLNRGRTVSLDVLVDTLWPGGTADPVANRNSLRVHMSNLRRWVRDIAGDGAASRFETRGDGYALSLESAEFDVVAFENAVALGQNELLKGRHDAANDSLRAALAMWAHPYPELPHHQPVESERIRLVELHGLAEDELIEVNIRQGHASEVIGQIEARLLEHPFRERSYGQLMRALYSVGRQADALDAYQRARHCLLDELGLEPGQALRDIETQILTHTVDRGNEPVATLERPTGIFVGRDVDLRSTVRALDHSDFVIILGEAGIGKTRFVNEIAHEATDQTWIWARSSSDRSAPPMWSILHSLGFTSEPERNAVSEFERNHRLVQDLQKRGSRVVLVLDDFHWADEATVRFVRQLAEYETEALVTIICSRSAPAYLGTDAGATALELGRRESSHQVTLEALDAQATAAIIDKHPTGSTREARYLHQRSAGNPLFLTELLSAGDVAANVPPVIANVVISRLHGADAPITSVLTTAAVIDDEIDPSIVLRAGSFSAGEVVAAIEHGRSMGLISTTESGHATFAHSLLRESLSTLVSATDRCRIHDRVASEIETRFEVNEHSKYRLAHHAFHALPLGSALRSAQASSAAGALAAKAFAFADARGHYRQARAAADYLDPDDRQTVLPSILCELGYHTIRAGNTPPGRELLMTAVEAARRLNDDALFVRAARCLTEAAAPAGTNDQAISEIVERALEISAGDETEDRVQLLVDLAGLRYFTHDLAHRKALCDDSFALAHRVGDRALAIASTGTWAAIYEPSTVDERMRLVTAARDSARRSRSVDQAILNASLEIGTSFELGRIRHAISVLDQVQSQAKPLQAPRLKWFMHGWSVVVDVLHGRLAEADDKAHTGLVMWEEGSHQDSVAAFGGQLVMIRILQRRAGELVDLLRGTVIAEPNNLAYQALLAAVIVHEDTDEAGAIVHALLEVLERDKLRGDALTTTTLAFLAETINLVPDVDPARAERLAESIEPLTHMHTVVNGFGAGAMYWGSMHHAHGLALAAAGKLDLARLSLEQAVTEHDRVGAVLFSARSRDALDQIGLGLHG